MDKSKPTIKGLEEEYGYSSQSQLMKDLKIPALTADVFIHDDDLNFILIKRSKGEFADYWALPGGYIEYGERVENGAIREAKEETNIDITLEELVNVYSDPKRDSRCHTISVVYTARGDFSTGKAGDDAKDIGIFSKDDLNEIRLAFDHDKIIKDCFNKVLKL